MNTKAKWTHPVVQVESTNSQYRHSPNSNSILKAQFMHGIYTSQLLHTLKTQKGFQPKKKKTQKGLVVNHNEIDRDF